MYENLLRNGGFLYQKNASRKPKKTTRVTTLRRSTLHHKLESASQPSPSLPRPPLQTFGRRQAGGCTRLIYSVHGECVALTARRGEDAPAIGRAVVFSVYLAIQLASLRARESPREASEPWAAAPQQRTGRPPDRATRCPARRAPTRTRGFRSQCTASS